MALFILKIMVKIQDGEIVSSVESKTTQYKKEY